MSKSRIIFGDNRLSLKKLIADGIKVRTVVTSPPYFGLRDYGTGKWEGGNLDCNHKKNPPAFDKIATAKSTIGEYSNTAHSQEGYKEICKKCGAKRIDFQIGLEATPEKYVENIVEVFRLIWDVLEKDGTVWLNLGDSYMGSWGATSHKMDGKAKRVGSNNRPATSYKHPYLKPKDLIGVPWKVAFALQKDGWWLRSDIVWAKPNQLPESVTDRCTKSHEYVFMLTKSRRYYYNADAIKEPYTDSTYARISQNIKNQKGTSRANGGRKTNGPLKALGKYEELTKEGGAGTSFKGHSGYLTKDGKLIGNGMKNKRDVWWISPKPYKGSHTAVFPKELVIPCVLAGSKKGDFVLDPFAGTGTVGEVAKELDRKFILLELNTDCRGQIYKRLGKIIT